MLRWHHQLPALGLRYKLATLVVLLGRGSVDLNPCLQTRSLLMGRCIEISSLIACSSKPVSAILGLVLELHTRDLGQAQAAIGEDKCVCALSTVRITPF